MKDLSDVQARWIVVVLATLTSSFCLSPWSFYSGFPATWTYCALLLIALHGEPPNMLVRLGVAIIFGAFCFFVLDSESVADLYLLGCGIILCAIAAFAKRRFVVLEKLESSLWLIATVFASGIVTRAGSADYGASGMIDWFAQFGFSPTIAEICTITIRKLIHLSFFGVLAGTAFLSFGTTTPKWNRVTWPLAWTLLHASFDEYRQSLTPNRTGTIADVAIDLIGAATAIWILHTWAKRKSSRHESSQPPPA